MQGSGLDRFGRIGMVSDGHAPHGTGKPEQILTPQWLNLSTWATAEVAKGLWLEARRVGVTACLAALPLGPASPRPRGRSAKRRICAGKMYCSNNGYLSNIAFILHISKQLLIIYLTTFPPTFPVPSPPFLLNRCNFLEHRKHLDYYTYISISNSY